MVAKDYRYIGNTLRYRFTKEHPHKEGASPQYMPSIIAISADVIDLYYKRNNKMKYKMDIVNCDMLKDCEEDQDCVYRKRVFYAYLDSHFGILQKPEKLDDGLRIDNHYPSESGNPLQKIFAKGFTEKNCGVFILAFRVLYRCYDIMSFDNCYCMIDDYEEILASIFLFCPKILCYAIKEELKASDKANIHVTAAIQRCLDFSARLDQKNKEEVPRERKAKKVFYDDILNEINSFHILRNVENALTDGADQGNDIADVVKIIMEISSNVITEVKKRVSEWAKQNNSKKFEKALEGLIGNDNYKYIDKSGLNVYR